MTDTPTSSNATLSSATNFDLPSLYLLRPELDVALKNAEIHLGEFNDDAQQAPLLLDSIDVLKQLTTVLELVTLSGASQLAGLIAEAMQALYDEGDNTNDSLILDISQSVMTLSRYIEFVLMQETLAPALLLDVINRLNKALGKPQITEADLNRSPQTSVSIINPEKNYKSLTLLDIDTSLLVSVYRAGLQVALNSNGEDITLNDKRNLVAMHTACTIAADETDALFWHAAQAVTQDLEDILPLQAAQKRTLIFLEQQFQNYLPANDNRFADLVSFACSRDNSMAKALADELANKTLDDDQKLEMKRYLFGPDRELASTLNQLIQSDIDNIKTKVDILSSDNEQHIIDEAVVDISHHLKKLAKTLKILNLPEAADAMQKSAEQVSGWQTPTAEDLDKLLNAFTIGENAAINLVKTHTPGVMKQPIHHSNVSVYQLDTAYETLVIESRTVLASIEYILIEYVQQNDESNTMAQAFEEAALDEVPELINQVAGAIRFLNLDSSATMLSGLARYISKNLVEEQMDKNEEADVLSHIANVLMAVDYQLSGLQNNHPVADRALQVGKSSLGELLAA